MKRIRLIAGTLLIVLSVAGMILWETKGREVLLMEEVLVAAENMEEGKHLSSSMFETAHILKENVADGALGPDDKKNIQSYTAGHTIAKRQQITKSDILPAAQRLKKDLHIFPIKADWIDARSSSLRKGDWIDIYQATSGVYLGTYELAFVKDESDQEVKNVESGKGRVPLDRTSGTGLIHHVEIIAAVSDYQNIRLAVGASLNPEEIQGKLTLVGTNQKEDKR